MKKLTRNDAGIKIEEGENDGTQKEKTKGEGGYQWYPNSRDRTGDV
jgi:hypothetical protein